ncbi:hypothetical protein ACSBR2_040272 [Camellia fascicularis]
MATRSHLRRVRVRVHKRVKKKRRRWRRRWSKIEKGVVRDGGDRSVVTLVMANNAAAKVGYQQWLPELVGMGLGLGLGIRGIVGIKVEVQRENGGVSFC